MKNLWFFVGIMLGLFSAAAAAQEIALHPDTAVLSGPFVRTNGCLYQPLTTDLASGGRALFRFSVTNEGVYVIQASVNVQGSHTQSFYINIDGEPKETEMIWDIPRTSGFEPRLVTWRGQSSPARPQQFKLSAGAHELLVRGKDANAQLQSLTLLPLPAAPTGLHIVSGP